MFVDPSGKVIEENLAQLPPEAQLELMKTLYDKVREEKSCMETNIHPSTSEGAIRVREAARLKSLLDSLKPFDGERSAAVVNHWVATARRAIVALGLKEESREAKDFIEEKLGPVALNWFHSMELAGEKFSNGAEVLRCLHSEFFPAGDIAEALQALNRISQGNASVAEYCNKFRELSNRVPDISQRERTQKFLNGLQPQIRQQLVSFAILTKQLDALTLNMAMESAMELSAAKEFLGEKGQEKRDPDAMIIDTVGTRENGKKCSFCKKAGHVVAFCWWLFPKGKFYKGKKEKEAGLSNVLVKALSEALVPLVAKMSENKDIHDYSKFVPVRCVKLEPKDGIVTSGDSEVEECSRRLFGLGKDNALSKENFEERRKKWLHDAKSNPGLKKVKLPVQLNYIGASSDSDRNKFLFAAKVGRVETSLLVDTGAQANVIGGTKVEMMKGRRVPCDPVKMEYANGSTEVVKEVFRTKVQVEKYCREIDFYIAGIGDSVILGAPFLESIVCNNIDWARRVFGFRDRETGRYFEWLGVGSTSDKSVRKPLSKEAQAIHFVRFQEVERHIASAHWVGTIDLQEVLDVNECSMQEAQEQRQEKDPFIESLKVEFKDQFGVPKNLPPQRPEDIKIELVPGARIPKWRGIGKLSESELKILKEKLEDLLARGFIRPSTSPYGASILFVKKSDGSLRLCVDYRGLNNVTMKNRGPIPNVTEMRGRLEGATCFSKIDLRDGYYNIRVSEEDVPKTAFRCRYGHFEFRVLPFGLANAPAVFSAMMNRVFGDFFDDFVISYLDDVVIYSQSREEHENHLRKVFQRLKEHQLHVKLEKCSFFQHEVEFCGNMVGRNGLYISKNKAEAMTVDPEIKSVQELRSYLGSCVWFAQFIPDYAAITAPLTDLTRKDVKWRWTTIHDEAILLLRHLISTAPVLKLFNPELETVVFTDASLYGIGGWIGQVHSDGVHPVTFWSRKLTDAERNYTTHEQELLALVEMCDRHAYYLRGVQFQCNTDHRSLEYLQSQVTLNRRQARWVLVLQDFDIKISYMPGKLNTVADFLTRNPAVAPLCDKCKSRIKINSTAVNKFDVLDPSNSGPVSKENIRAAYDTDELIRKIRAWYTDPKAVPLAKAYFYRQFSCSGGVVVL